MENRLVITLSDGEEVLDCVSQAIKENNIHYAKFIEVSGELRDFDVLSDNYDRPGANDFVYLLDKVSGTVLNTPSGPKINLHGTLVRKGVSKHGLITGQLKRAVVNGFLEITLQTKDLSKMIY